MTETELEQEFYKVFEIYPATVQEYGATYFWDTIEIDGKRYTPIDDRKLLEMICIWNYIMPCIDDCIIPIDYLGLKSVVLNKIIRYSEIEYEFDINALKHQIQQLFKEKE